MAKIYKYVRVLACLLEKELVCRMPLFRLLYDLFRRCLHTDTHRREGAPSEASGEKKMGSGEVGGREGVGGGGGGGGWGGGGQSTRGVSLLIILQLGGGVGRRGGGGIPDSDGWCVEEVVEGIGCGVKEVVLIRCLRATFRIDAV